jgi:hypothetical protein
MAAKAKTLKDLFPETLKTTTTPKADLKALPKLARWHIHRNWQSHSKNRAALRDL